MATYVQFKDGVAFAHVTTDGILDDPSFVAVDCSGHEHLGQKWDGAQWTDAQPIRYAILDDHNTIVQINTTLHSSEVNGKILQDDAIQVNWTFDGTTFNPPVDPVAAIQAANAAKMAAEKAWLAEQAQLAAQSAQSVQSEQTQVTDGTQGVQSTNETTGN